MKKKTYIIVGIVLILSVGVFVNMNKSTHLYKGEIDSVRIKYAKENNIELSKDILFLDNQNLNISYNESIDNNNQKVNVYLDTNNNEYIYQDNKLVGFLKNISINKNETNQLKNIDETKSKDYKNIAIKTAKDIISNNLLDESKFEEYTLVTEEYVESYNEMYYTFMRIINGYKTSDTLSISIGADGNVSSFTANRLGLFNNIKNLSISDSDVDNYINETMINEYNTNNYIVNSKTIDIIDNKTVVTCFITIIHENNLRSTTLLYYNL